MSQSDSLHDPLELTGQKLGPYVVGEISTVGGVALIYRGEHETLHNQVAVKVLTPEVASEEARPTLETLFMREAQILSQLRSEDILRAHDLGRAVCPSDGRERPYMIVDWLEGLTLAQEIDARIERGEPAYQLKEIVDVLEPIARALAYAHANGIVHRDVNPRNIFLEQRPGGVIHAKLIDFGFAKDVSKTNLRIQRVGGTLLARSPDYSAPEHYDREKYGDLSEMTDLYTLALTLVEALTLELPLRGATPEAQFLCTADRETRPTPRTRGVAISDRAEALFQRALAVDQFDRPHAVKDWWDELREAADEPAVAAPPPARPGLPAIPPTPPEPPSVPSPPSGSLPETPPSVESLPPPPVRPRHAVRVIGWLLALVVFALGAAVVASRFLPWPMKCPPDRGDCNRLAYDACETDLASDDRNCGACQAPCPADNARALCSSGQCNVVACKEAGHQDCNKDALDGCEIDVENDSKNCGACGKVCDSTGAKRAGCVNGTCQVVCDKGFGDCDQKPETGCETSLDRDPKNCGRCGFACRDGRCEAGLCTPTLVTTAKSIERLAAASGRIVFWDPDTKQLQSVTSGAEPTPVANATDVAALAVGKDVVVWSTEKPAAVWASSFGSDGGAPKQLGGPLPKPTPLVVDASGTRVSWWGIPAGTLPGPLAKPRTILTAPLDASLLAGLPAANDCKVPLAAFAGDDAGQVCCQPGGPLVALDCRDGICKTKRYGVKCAERITVDPNFIYWTQDVRVMVLDRATGKPRQIVKHGKPTHALAFDADYVYWLEGAPDVDVMRVKKPQLVGTPTGVELLARKQPGATLLAVDEKGIYWTRRHESGGMALMMLSK
jgi:serine/threonine protein kinase